MLTDLMAAELAAARHAERLADAEIDRLALRMRRARRDQRGSAATPRVRRTWLRTATQPARP